jgi:amino acid adenylation domain-containing protein/FkbH-like protein/thioester reductase-like protein
VRLKGAAIARGSSHLAAFTQGQSMNDTTSNFEKGNEPGKSRQLPEAIKSHESSSQTIAVAGTFVADLLREPLQLWMHKLAIAAEVELAPYGQIMQELLDPTSLFSRNERGFNVLLIRLEDWIRDRLNLDREPTAQHLCAVVDEFTAALTSSCKRTSTPALLVLCPSSERLPAVHRGLIDRLHEEISRRLAGIANLHCWSPQDVAQLYPQINCLDERADSIANIPYTLEYFVAVATLVARRIAVLTKPQFKVIAIDCDNTLWKGICAEDGATGIELTPAHLRLQEVLLRQYQAGMLLCLCSKNNPADVEDIFTKHPDMPLRPEHFISSRVNWSPKSQNLLSLAEELDLALSTFILVDDSPLECAEVRAHCPAVLTLQLPQSQAEILHLLNHTWAFDRVGVTEEARDRTAQYRQNRARKQALQEAADLEQFLSGLNLKVVVAPMQSAELTRVAELVRRTTQFNLRPIQRRGSEIDTLWRGGQLRILTVRVEDRFGDYGLVGIVFFRCLAGVLDVDTFALSCRVLGRGVEHRIVNELGRIAQAEGLADVVLRYRCTARNSPARTFLEASFGSYRAVADGDGQGAAEAAFRIPTQGACRAARETRSSDVPRESIDVDSPVHREQSLVALEWHEAAYRFSRVTDFLEEMWRCAGPRERVGRVAVVEPRDETERALAEIWLSVLRLPEVSVRDDFFEIGGDSLQAIQVISAIGSVLGRDVSVHAFFDAPTIEKIASSLADASEAGATIEPAARDDLAPLSSGQRSLWFIDRLEGGAAAYRIPLRVRLHGDLNRDALQTALDALLSRHEVLRTSFVEIDAEPWQCIASAAHFPLRFVDLTAAAAERRDVHVLEHSREELATSFDLRAGPLIRGRLLRIAPKQHVLLLTVHHIVFDGWSAGVLIRELSALYAAYAEGRPDCLPVLPVRYADYAHWQCQRAASEQLAVQLAAWREHLQGAPELLELPADRTRPAAQSYRGATVRVVILKQLVDRLKAFSRQHGLTLAMTLYTAWSVVLSRLSGQQDLVVGMPVANRRRSELEGLIGLFVNTLAIRLRLDDDPSALELLQRAKQTMLEAYERQDVPFEKVVEALHPTRSLTYSPVFQSMFVLQSAALGTLQASGLQLTEEEVPLDTAKFDLTLSLRESAGDMVGTFNYASDLFNESTIKRWAGYFENLLHALMASPRSPISRLALLLAAQREEVTQSFNATQSAYPDDKLIQELFEGWAARTPDQAAVISSDRTLTFAQLNAEANQLARHLLGKGVGPDQLVALCAERSVEMVIGMLGILKAGGAYLPIDPDHPRERIAVIIDDAKPRVVLSQKGLRSILPQTAVEIVALDDWDVMGGYSTENLAARSLGQNPRQLAYVIYTSGSTGKPKGVMIEHRNVLSLWRGLEHIYLRTLHCSRVAVNASFTFDASVKQFVQLLSGRAIVLVPQECRWDASLLLRFMSAQCIDSIDCTPAQLRSWIAAGLLDGSRYSPRIVLVGGEPIDAALWRVLAQSDRTNFYNVYGPTESTVDTTFAHVRDEEEPPHIGPPMENRRVYILDIHGQPVPIGVPGELHIGGEGLARGYLNLPQLTAERFLPDPFHLDPRARMYKSGDIGRWRADGKIEYLGRGDLQVKVRGFRIETGEIEAQLLSHAQVEQAAVRAHEDVPGDKRLVAYVVLRSCSARSGEGVHALRTHLRSVLPEYMVPGTFVILETMPLTANGKVDRRRLPAPEGAAVVRQPYEVPQEGVEETLAGIWQQLLRVEHVGRHDNFFELGGHSLLVVQMLERLRRIGLPTDVRSVFENPSLHELALALTNETVEQIDVQENAIPDQCSQITPQMLPLIDLSKQEIEKIVDTVPGAAANVQDIYPLAPLQEGILFHHLMAGRERDVYVGSTVLALDSRERLQKLVDALQCVIDRHDALRSAVLWEGLSQPLQVVYRRAALPVHEVTCAMPEDAAAQIDAWLETEQQPLSLTRAPLMRLRVAASAGGGPLQVLLQTHHIVGDYRSREVLMQEVVACLNGAVDLPPAAPYRNHVAQALADVRKRDAERFFREKFGDLTEPTAPFGLVDVQGDGVHIEEALEEIGHGLAQRLHSQARRFGVSAAALIHAAWALVVAYTATRDDIVFGTVLLGRLQGSADLERTVGMFINTLPLRLKLRDVTVRALLEQAQRELVELFGHEQTSAATAQRCSGIVGSTPLFSALLNYRRVVSAVGAAWSDVAGVKVLATRERTNYPIVLTVDDRAQSFRLWAQTHRSIDPHRLIGYMSAAMESLITALEQAPDTRALELTVLPDAERRLILHQFNATSRPYPSDETIHRLFEEQVRRAPDAIAVVFDDRSHSYSELNGKANQLAWYLRSCGAQPGEFVPIMMARSLHMLIGQIAVLKSGGVYVPIDPELPAERRTFMIRDCAAKRVLVDGHALVDLHLDTMQWIDCAAALAQSNAENTDAAVTVSPLDPAYVMYTSGSTGVPKGVVVPHQAVSRLAINNGFAEIESTDCIAHHSNPAFDASTFEIWGALLTGARVAIIHQAAVLEAECFAEALRRERVTIMYISAGLFNQYCNVLTGVFPQLRYLMVGGESLEPGAIRRVLRDSPPQHLMNAYGPTECTTFSTTHLIESVDGSATSIPIGKPMANAQIYILDAGRRLVPIGVTGEMYIGGAGVACGYLNRQELTAERFVANTFAVDPQARMYRTGDLARWRADGAIEFLGRNDHQVKIRGLRIELGEIEARLAEHARVAEAAVIAREDAPGEKRLVAYMTCPDPLDAPRVDELRDYLKSLLPEYMIPSAFVLLEQIPLTSTGKVDRRALPPPAANAYATRRYEPPLGVLEETVAAIWCELLGIECIGRDDNFFDLGGHSLLAVRALTTIKHSLDCTLRVKDLYTNPTIREVASRINAGTGTEEHVELSKEAQLAPNIVATKTWRRSAHDAVLLTGATGFVGRFLLTQLLCDTEATVYCIVRAPSEQQAAARLRATLANWDLWQEGFERRVVAVAGDLRQPRLGIGAARYQVLLQDIDVIYHCGTSMNHLETYAMAKAANVAGTTELLTFAGDGKPKLINHISTLGVFRPRDNQVHRVVSESTSIDDEIHLAANGYAASKWVSEKLLMRGIQRGIPCNIFRLGLVWADMHSGRYDELQRSHRVIKSSLLSGCGIVNYRHDMPPTPVDYVARAVVSLGRRYQDGGGIFHISSSFDMVQGLFERCNEILGAELELMSHYDWICENKRLHELGLSLPALPLIESAFGVDRRTFEDSLRRTRSIRFDCTRTHTELGRAGIVTPVFDDDLLTKCLCDMIERDPQLRDWSQRRNVAFAGAQQFAPRDIGLRD